MYSFCQRITPWLVAVALMSATMTALARPERPALRTQKDIQPTVRRLMDKARGGAPRTVIIEMESTFAFGCDCPPFVYRGMDSASTAEEFLFPKIGPATPDPAKYQVPGTFHLTGHFTGRRINMIDWHRDRGEPSEPPADGREYWLEPHPEFVVEKWCFTPPPRRRLGYSSEEWTDIGETIQQMKKEGVPWCR